jgi:hypothetical protein
MVLQRKLIQPFNKMQFLGAVVTGQGEDVGSHQPFADARRGFFASTIA